MSEKCKKIKYSIVQTSRVQEGKGQISPLSMILLHFSIVSSEVTTKGKQLICSRIYIWNATPPLEKIRITAYVQTL